MKKIYLIIPRGKRLAGFNLETFYRALDRVTGKEKRFEVSVLQEMQDRKSGKGKNSTDGLVTALILTKSPNDVVMVKEALVILRLHGDEKPRVVVRRVSPSEASVIQAGFGEPRSNGKFR